MPATSPNEQQNNSPNSELLDKLQRLIELLQPSSPQTTGQTTVSDSSVEGSMTGGETKVGGNFSGRDSITLNFNLATVLQQLPVHNIQELFQESLPPYFEKNIYTPNLQQALDSLSQVVDENRKAISYPKFLSLIAQQIAPQQPDIAQKIQSLIKLLPNLGGNLTQEDVQTLSVEQLPPPETTLMVELIPARAKVTDPKKQKYYVRFYLWQEGTNNHLKSYDTEVLYKLSEIPAHIEKVIQEKYSNPKPHLLEIFVSLDILVTAEGLDWVEYKDKVLDIEVPRRLGMSYKIALRSLERQRDHKLKTIYRSQWVSKWSYLCQCLPVEKIPFQEKIDLTFLEKLARNWPDRKSVV